MSTTVKHPTLRLGVELAIGRGVDAPLGLQLSEARPNRPDPENPPPLPWEAGVRRTLTAPDAPPAALVPLACALLGAPPGHADCRSLRNRVPAVDELPHGIPRDGIGEVVLTGGIVRDPHPALPTFQEVGGDPTTDLEAHHSSPRLRTRSPSSSAASRMCSRFRPPTPPAIRTAHTFASTPFSSAAVWTTTSRNPLGWRPRAVFGPRKPIDTTLIRHPMCRRRFAFGFRPARLAAASCGEGFAAGFAPAPGFASGAESAAGLETACSAAGPGGGSSRRVFFTFRTGFGVGSFGSSVSSSAILRLLALARDVDAVLEHAGIEPPDLRRLLDVRGGLPDVLDVQPLQLHLIARDCDLRLPEDPRAARGFLSEEVLDDELAAPHARLHWEVREHDLHLVREARRDADDHVPHVRRKRADDCFLPPAR